MQVISIITRGRSGALFLQSLLDSHYKIATIPGPFLSDYFSWYKKNKNLSLKSLIYNFVNIHNLIFDYGNDTTDNFGFTKMGKERNEKLSVDTNLFISSFLDFFKENKEISRKKIFINIHLAYSLAVGHDIKNINTIVYYMHDYSFTKAQLLQSDFPEGKFIHMVRETTQTIVSILNNYYNSNMFVAKRSYVIAEAFSNINQHFYPLTNKIDHTIFLKLEDLHLNSFMTMKKLSLHLNLVWDDKLLHSTFNNKVWWNYSASKKISGFNKSIVKIKKYKILSDLNLKILDSLFLSTNKIFTYENKSKKYNIFLAIFLMFIIPFRFEILGFRAADKKIKDVFFILNKYFLLRRIIISTILKTYNYQLLRKFPFFQKNNSKKKFINGLK